MTVNDINAHIIHVYNKYPHILDILLLDRTRTTDKNKHNIIWANNHFTKYGIAYEEHHEINATNINIVKARVLKNNELKKSRTKDHAEVFTPIKIVKYQNELLDENFANDDLLSYIKRKWLEVSCGEGPYIVSLYDPTTGRVININERVGFLDKKLSRINKEINSKNKW